MSNLIAKTRVVSIEGREYIIKFDMTSIEVFQDIMGSGISNYIGDLIKFNDRVVLAFLAAALRSKSDPEKPLGNRIYSEFDILTLLVSCADAVALIVIDSLPKSNNRVKKK